MDKFKNPKWETSQAIRSGNDASELIATDRAELERRLKPDEITEFQSNLEELKKRQPGQQEVLTHQKAKTRGQNEAIKTLNKTISSVKNMVKAAGAPENILKAFGVGEKISDSVPGMVAAGNIIVKAYGEHAEWVQQNAGVLEEDIAEITALTAGLTSADSTQENAKFTRKATTLDKDVLQRAVEDFVTKLSAIGTHIFLTKDPARATLYQNLIPGTHQAPAGEEPTIPQP